MFESVRETKKVVRKVIPEGKLLNQYLKIKTIGQGPYSKIKLMKNIDDGKFFAMKKYNLFILKKKNKMMKRQNNQVFYTTAAQQVLNQVKVLKLLNHPNVAKLIEVIEDLEEEKLYLFLEYCQHGDFAFWSPKNQKFTMNKQIKNINDLKKSFLSIARAIQYLHSNDIIHRDIKPQNILLDKDLNIKIIDFGRAVKLENSNQRLKGSEGTYHFMAPEMLSEIFKQGYNGKQCDMWSLGVSFFGILFETLPFYHELMIKLFQQIEHGQYKFPNKFKQGYEIFLPIIQKLLKVNPEERLTAQELIKILQKLM